jgi:hypothetical protein
MCRLSCPSPSGSLPRSLPGAFGNSVGVRNHSSYPLPISSRFLTQFYVAFLGAASPTGFSSGAKEDRIPKPGVFCIRSEQSKITFA